LPELPFEFRTFFPGPVPKRDVTDVGLQIRLTFDLDTVEGHLGVEEGAISA
jgi:hypothetical protein